jgi:pyruvate formate lyase activating enzyme
MSKTGNVFDIQSFSVHDGPGVRTTVFLKGCPLKCWWCANPEGQLGLAEVSYHADKCQGCMECAKGCQFNAIEKVIDFKKGEGYIKVNKEKCRKCLDFSCVYNCPNQALITLGKFKTVEEVMKVIKRDISYFGINGGVTLSGGEPLYQSDFSLEILKACREEYIHTAMETTLFAPFDIVEKFIPLVDLFLCDIKQMDSIKHKEYTGVQNENILKNITKLCKITKNIVIRVPLIPGCNDDAENIKATAKFAHENGIDRLNILPYHKLGISKYKQLGIVYSTPDKNPPNVDAVEILTNIVENQGVKCIIG